MGLTPGTRAGLLVHVDTTGSTNDRARELAEAGAPSGTVVVAEQQTAGRGRQGRSWTTPRERALTLSMLMRTDAERMHDLAILAPVAVCQACERVARVEARIKWPNDVWIEQRKVAGILIEARPQVGWAVIGIGVNVNTSANEFPPELRDGATSLAIATGSKISRAALLDAVLERLARLLEQRPQAVLDAYRTRDALLDRQIEWAGGSGTAKGVNERGDLVVFTDAGERLALDAGEVHLHGFGGGRRPTLQHEGGSRGA